MYKKKLETSNIPELKSIYDNDLEKSVFDKDQQQIISNEEHRGQVISNEEHRGRVISNEEHRGQVISNKDPVISNKDPVISNEDLVISNEDLVISNDGSSSEKSITFNRIKKKVVRKIMFIKNKIKTNSVDYKLDLINDAINKINGRIILLEIKVNNLELDINKNKNELIEHDRLTTMEMTNINDKLNNANIIILD